MPLHIDPLLVITATAGEGAFLRDALRSSAGARGGGAGDADDAVGEIGSTRIRVLALGVGKSNTAAGLARALVRDVPAAVVQLGVGGTYAGSFLPVGGVAVAAAEYDLDFGVTYAEGWEGAERLGFGLWSGVAARSAAHPAVGRATRSGAEATAPGNGIPTDPELSRWLARDGRVPMVAFGTSDAVSGDLEVAAARHRRFDLSVESMEGAAAAQTALAAGVPFAELRGISNVAGQREKAHWDVRGSARAATAVLVAALRDTR